MDLSTVEKYFFSKIGWIPFLVFVIAICELLKSFININGISLLFIACLSYLCWYFIVNNISLKENKINLIISIKPETEKEATILKNDLIEEIKRRCGKDINIIIFNPLLIELYNDHIVEKFLNRHFPTSIIFITGKIKRRDDGNYYMETKAHWNHEKIKQAPRNHYSKQMSKYFPEYKIPIEKEVIYLKITSEIITFAVELITIITLEISKKYELSFKKTTDLLKSRQQIKNFIQIQDLYSHILYNIGKIITNDYELFLYEEKEDGILRIEKFLNDNKDTIKNISLCANKEAICSTKAITTFLTTRDTKKARKYLKNLQIFKDIRAISSAFLFAYNDNIIDCEREYRKLKKSEYNPSSTLQTEYFINKILNQEPEKYSLYFCLGYINKFLKGDEKLAKENFLKFIEKSTNENLNHKIRQWIE